MGEMWEMLKNVVNTAVKSLLNNNSNDTTAAASVTIVITSNSTKHARNISD